MASMDMPGMEMPGTETESGGSSPGAAAYLGAWGVMMAAMMLPSAIPMVAMYGAMQRNNRSTDSRGVSTAFFASVYLVAWLAYGVPVYLGSVAVERLADRSPAPADAVPYVLALTLVGAGLFQFSTLKRVCLRNCQNPFIFYLSNWRSGYAGTLRMAWKHAVYCLGCCWALMVVLVAAGAMALHWVLLIAALVFAEKVLPASMWTVRLTGFALIGLGVSMAVFPQLADTLRAGGM